MKFRDVGFYNKEMTKSNEDLGFGAYSYSIKVLKIPWRRRRRRCCSVMLLNYLWPISLHPWQAMPKKYLLSDRLTAYRCRNFLIIKIFYWQRRWFLKFTWSLFWCTASSFLADSFCGSSSCTVSSEVPRGDDSFWSSSSCSTASPVVH